MRKAKRPLEKRFRNRFGSNACWLTRASDGSVEVVFNLPGPMKHLMSLRVWTQVVHAIKSSKDEHWIFKNKELDILLDYFSLLRKLCEDNWYPDEEKMRRIRRLGRRTMMTRLLKVIYGDRFTAEFVE